MLSGLEITVGWDPPEIRVHGLHVTEFTIQFTEAETEYHLNVPNRHTTE